MRLAILVADNMVVIDGVSETVDLQKMPREIRAVQWDGSTGHVEHHNLGEHRPNEPIDRVDDYQWVVDAWAAAAVERKKREQASLDNAGKLIETVVDHENLARLAKLAEAEGVRAGKARVLPFPEGFPEGKKVPP
jgi:hypothetical protein